MSIRIKRIAEDYNQLKTLYKQKTITQLKAYPGEKKSVDHLAVLLEGPKGTPYQEGKFMLEIKFGPSNKNFKPVVHIIGHHLLEIENLGLIINQGKHVQDLIDRFFFYEDCDTILGIQGIRQDKL